MAKGTMIQDLHLRERWLTHPKYQSAAGKAVHSVAQPIK
jgi:hypothetical protein